MVPVAERLTLRIQAQWFGFATHNAGAGVAARQTGHSLSVSEDGFCSFSLIVPQSVDPYAGPVQVFAGFFLGLKISVAVPKWTSPAFISVSLRVG